MDGLNSTSDMDCHVVEIQFNKNTSQQERPTKRQSWDHSDDFNRDIFGATAERPIKSESPIKVERPIKCESRPSSDSDDSDHKNNFHRYQDISVGKAERPVKSEPPIKAEWPIKSESCITSDSEDSDDENKHDFDWYQDLFGRDTSKVKKQVEPTRELILDRDPETEQARVSVDKRLMTNLKAYQEEGVRFMWDACFGSVDKIAENDPGSGCILAHCMGLGKTRQVVTLVHTLLNNEQCQVKRVLIVCPVTTIVHWNNEFSKWLPVKSDHIKVHYLTREKKNRRMICTEWFDQGGVLIIGYQMFRLLSKKKDLIHQYLVKPGADVAVFDEGHVLKNPKAAITKAVKGIATKRRIILTGTPMQNNLMEYYCMAQIIRPGMFGNSSHFRRRFVNPINEGQNVDSTDDDVVCMKKRAYVFHKTMKDCVHRLDYTLLANELKPKVEYVISVQLSEQQIRNYTEYLQHESVWLQLNGQLYRRSAKRKFDSENGLRDLLNDFDFNQNRNDSDGEDGYDDMDKGLFVDYHHLSRICSHPKTEQLAKLAPSERRGILQDEENGDGSVDVELSGKMVLLMDIIERCDRLQDKLLVFSHSLLNLDLIEKYLADRHFTRNVHYYRFDGSTPIEQRAKWCDSFNDEENTRAQLFLISTRAGGMGINLIGANRVVLFDASWNPANDIQSIFRVYRLGQRKNCFVYRFVAQGAMEEKIYERQVVKQSLAARVVDDQEIRNHYKKQSIEDLYDFRPHVSERRSPLAVPLDRLFAGVIHDHAKWVVSYHEHDSLLQHFETEKLSDKERQDAWHEYQSAKRKPAQKLPNLVDLMERFQRQNSAMSDAQCSEYLKNYLQEKGYTDY